jgi:hypothetical protein
MCHYVRILVAAWALCLAGVPAHAMTKEELKTVMATMLNLNGHLCAEVIDIRPLQVANQFEVTCIEYRGGSGRVRYIFDGNTGKAFKAG